MQKIIKPSGTTLTRMTYEETGLRCPIVLMKAKIITKEATKKDIYKYGMTKEEYNNYLSNLYN